MKSRPKINWWAIIAQGLILSISIYVPFFLEKWNDDQESIQINDQYKEFLIEDLQIDLAVIDTMINQNQIYLDSAMSIFILHGNDSSVLMQRANKALMLGVTDEFYPVTDVDTYIDQFRKHGETEDLQLVRELDNLKIMFQKASLIDKRRELYRQEYYTPMYLNKYSIKEGFPKVKDMNYFNTDYFFNSVSLLYRQSVLTGDIYKRARKQCEIVFKMLNNNNE